MSIIRFIALVIAGAILGAAAGAAILAQDAWLNAPAGGYSFGTRESYVRFAIVGGLFYGAIFGAFVGLIVQLLGLGKLGGAAFGAAVGFVIAALLFVYESSWAVRLWGLLSIFGLSLVGLSVAFLANALREPDQFR